MEGLAHLVAQSMVRHGFEPSFDHRRLQWSSWFRCQDSFTLVLAPCKPGLFALGEEIIAPGEMGVGEGKRMLALFQISEADDLGRDRRAVAIANDVAVRSVCESRGIGDLSVREFRRRVLSDGYSIPHTVGTCAMGPIPADGAVVDARLAMHGIEALNVVDASVIPDAPSGFTHLPTIMLAEAFADRFDQ